MAEDTTQASDQVGQTTNSGALPSQANYGVLGNLDINAIIQSEVAKAVAKAQQDQVAATAPKELTPEEKLHAALDSNGVGKGIEERFAELYDVLRTLAGKIGV